MTNKEKELQEKKQVSKKIEELKKKLKQCEEEKEKYLSGWKRAKANFLNYKKEEQKRLDRARDEIEKDLILEILPVLDSFDRAEENTELEEGMKQIKKELQSVLKRKGVEKISTNCKFDPNLHEAVEQLPSDEKQGTIVEEVTAGYKFKDEV
ncbi:MAG: nucleotide exchange factor GrpE, partial [Candidatus Paceibacterota bacterium]